MFPLMLALLLLIIVHIWLLLGRPFLTILKLKEYGNLNLAEICKNLPQGVIKVERSPRNRIFDRLIN